MATHYEILSVAQNAPDSIIKAAYKVLAQAYHPDKYQGDKAEAERMIKLINTAYTVLIDPAMRARYDAWLEAQSKKPPPQELKPSTIQKTFSLIWAIISWSFLAGGFTFFAYVVYVSKHPHEQITYPSLTLQKLPTLPPTGAITSASIGVAPLRISVDSDTHYLIKIIDTRTNWDIGQWFIRAGESIDIKVPLGSYKIKYAAGKMWYGLNDLFGNDTIYSKADSTFDFTAHNIGYATQYSGHTIQLIAQPNGNLHTSRMNAADW